MVAYKVGSSDEDLDSTGLSHYLEHLMFKGTDKLKPGDIDHITFRNSGANNAYTDTDYTIFISTSPTTAGKPLCKSKRIGCKTSAWTRNTSLRRKRGGLQ